MILFLSTRANGEVTSACPGTWASLPYIDIAATPSQLTGYFWQHFRLLLRLFNHGILYIGSVYWRYFCTQI